MTGPLLGPVEITAREIYDRVVLVGALVERVSLQLTDLGTKTADHEQRLRDLEAHRLGERVDDHDQRLRRLESGRWPLPALAVLVSVAALALPFLSRL